MALSPPRREGRRPRHIGKKGSATQRGSVGGTWCRLRTTCGVGVAWDGASAHVYDTTVPPLLRQFDAQRMVCSAAAVQARAGDPSHLKLCGRGEWNDPMLIEPVFSLLTVVRHFPQVMPRAWADGQARLAFTMAAFPVLAQYDGLPVNAEGFGPLSIAAFRL